jgi:hypothetical protein
MIDYAGVCYRDARDAQKNNNDSAFLSTPFSRIACAWFIVAIAADLEHATAADLVSWSKLWYHWKYMHCSYGTEVDAQLAAFDTKTHI